MKKVAAAEFKARCLTLMENVQKTREPVLITKRGKPVAKLVTFGKDTDEIYNFLRGEGTLRGLSTALLLALCTEMRPRHSFETCPGDWPLTGFANSKCSYAYPCKRVFNRLEEPAIGCM